MAHVKTAISVDREVFVEAEGVAAELHISRSDLYTRALRLLLRQRRTLRLQEDIARAAAELAEFSTSHDAGPDSLHNIASETMRRAIERGESTW
ncbi:MAG TPA: hypothetical protein VNL35_10790 [Chloroflexota bacterium]|nr:hypothetical protein [Chloroflexota bacterium]